MKKLLIALTMSAGLYVAIVWLPHACGQDAAPAPRSTKPATPLKIAVIDMGVVIREYKRTADARQDVKTVYEAALARHNEQVAKYQTLGKELKDAELDPESPEFRNKEKKIVQLSSEITTSKAVVEKELKHREAKAIMSIHKEVTKAARVIAEQNGYTLVLRIDRDGLAAKSYATIQQTMAQVVVRYDGREDITDAVIDYLNQQYATTAGDSGKAGEVVDKAPGNKTASDRSAAKTTGQPDSLPATRKSLTR